MTNSRSLWPVALLAFFCGLLGGAGGYLLTATFWSPSGRGNHASLATPATPSLGEARTASSPAAPARTVRDVEGRNEIVRAAKLVNPAVVKVDTRTSLMDWRQYYMSGDPYQRGSGSGFIFDASGLVLTNQHVIHRAQEILVTLADGRTFEARVKGEDILSDIAVLAIEATDLPVAPLGSAKDLEVGEWVIAIGNPFREFEHSVSVGVVSAKGRTMQIDDRYYANLIQTDAAINMGNSGGPLVNLEGQVIGINSTIFSPTSTSVGLGFAIPIDDARVIARHLVETGQVPYVGIIMVDLTRELVQELGLSAQEGVLIYGITTQGPADLAGLQQGDVLQKIGKQSVRSTNEAAQAILQHQVGETVPFTVVREGETRTIDVKIGARQ